MEKKNYITPQVDCQNIQLKQLIAVSPGSLGIGGKAETEGEDGVVLGRRENSGYFWEEEEEEL